MEKTRQGGGRNDEREETNVGPIGKRPERLSVVGWNGRMCAERMFEGRCDGRDGLVGMEVVRHG